MARYLVEQFFPEGLNLRSDGPGARTMRRIQACYAAERVVWIVAYVTPDKRKMFLLCEAPSPEAIRRVSRCNSWPVDRINEVRTLDPYFLY